MSKKTLCVAVMAFAALGAGTVLGDPLAGLLGYWPFDGDAADASGNGHDGIVEGEPTYDEGRVGQALLLDGVDDRVLVGTWDPSEETGQVTVALWVYWDGTHTQNNIFVTKRGTWDEAGLAWQFVGKNDGSALFRNIPTTLRGGAGPGGEWVHWAATFDGQEAAIYKNAEIVAGPTAFAFTGGASSMISIGARSDDHSENFKGLLDEVRIYNRALTVDEIRELDPPRLQAYGPNPPDGDVTVVTPLLQWTAGDTAVLHDVYFGTDPNLGPEDLVQSRLPMALYFHVPGLTPGATYYWRVDEIEADMATVHTGNVWSFVARPDTAYLPNPADGTHEVSPDPNLTLTWWPGREVIEHHLYFGDRLDDVNDGAADTDRGTLTETTFVLAGPLLPLTTYYWRVDEIGVVDTTQGPVWSFTTFLAVDDVESYTAEIDVLDAWPIFQVWIDGVENGTGSYVGYEVAANGTFCETTIVHSGNQSMPLEYSNVDPPYYSETSRTWAAPQNWTVNGANTLVLYINGHSANAPESLYVAAQDTAMRIGVVVLPDASAVTTRKWTRWAIPLTAFGDAGVSLAAIKTMMIGLGNRDNPTPGGAGLIFVDDIRLVHAEPVVE